MSQMPQEMIDAELKRHRESEAGKALAAHGFHATHQGGGLVNYSGKRPDGRAVDIIAGVGDGWGPDSLSEPVDVLTEDEAGSGNFGTKSYRSLRAYLATPT